MPSRLQHGKSVAAYFVYLLCHMPKKQSFYDCAVMNNGAVGCFMYAAAGKRCFARENRVRRFCFIGIYDILTLKNCKKRGEKDGSVDKK